MDFKQLMQEKQDIENKIRKLEDMKQDIKPQVYEKIKGDYNDRLKDIENNIKQNTEAIMQEKANIENEIAELDNLSEELETELQEIRVRIQLGEYNEEEYADKLKEKEEKLNDYKLRKEQLTIKLNEYSMIIEEEGVSGADEGISEEAPPVTESAGMPEQEESEETVFSEESIPDSEDQPGDEDQLGVELGNDVGSEIREEDDIDQDEENPLNDILQPALHENESEDTDESAEFTDNQEKDASEEIEPIDTGLDQFLEEENEEDDDDKTMEGLKCPKCGHVNDPNSITCEKCGTDLFS